MGVIAMKRRVLELCAGAHSPAHEHKVFGEGRARRRVCRYCDKLIQEYPKGDSGARLRAHGRYLSTVPGE